MEKLYIDKPSTRISIGEQEPQIQFYEKYAIEPIIVIKKDKFIYKGQEIDDVHGVYEKMNEFLNNAKL
jgi:hypothetical protein